MAGPVAGGLLPLEGSLTEELLNAPPGAGAPGAPGGLGMEGSITEELLGLGTVNQPGEVAPVGADQGLGIGVNLAGGIASSDRGQLAMISEASGIPLSRFGMKDGTAVYQADDGSIQEVAPGFFEQAAATAGDIAPAVTGIGAGLLTANPAAGAVTAAATQGLRELAVERFAGEPASAARIATESAFDLAGGLGGKLLSMGFTRAAATQGGRVAQELVDSGVAKASDALGMVTDALNERFGTNIVLSAAELTNDPRLIGQQIAAQGTPTGGPRLAGNVAGRGAGIMRAFRQSLDDLSPADDPLLANRALSEAARETRSQITGRQGAEALLDFGNASSLIDERGGLDPLVTRARAGLDDLVLNRPDLPEVLNLSDSLGKTATDGSLIDLINGPMQQLDDTIRALEKRGMETAGSRLRAVRETLNNDLERRGAGFAAAANAFKAAQARKGGYLEIIAEAIDSPGRLDQLGRIIFGEASPAQIAKTRSAVLQAPGGEDAWRGAVRGYLGSIVKEAGAEVAGTAAERAGAGEALQAARVFGNLMADPQQIKRLQAALDPQQFKAFKNLIDVMGASGRATDFSTLQRSRPDMLRRARPGLVGGAGQVAGSLGRSAINPLGGLKPVQETVARLLEQSNITQLIDLITNKGSVKELVKIGSGAARAARNSRHVLKALNLARAATIGNQFQNIVSPGNIPIGSMADRPPRPVRQPVQAEPIGREFDFVGGP